MLTFEQKENRVSRTTGKCCRLLRPVRDHSGLTRFREPARILREIDNLDRHMFLVQFIDGATTFLFPYEVAIEDC